MNNKGIMDLIENMTKNEGIGKIILQDDFDNYMYSGDLLKYVRIGNEMGYRDIDEYKNYLTLNGKKLEGLLSILNRYFGERSSEQNGEKQVST